MSLDMNRPLENGGMTDASASLLAYSFPADVKLFS